MTAPSKIDAYEQAGVSIDRGEALVQAIKPAVKATARPGLMGGIGGFAGLFDLKACGYQDPILVTGADGVGTKLKIALDTGLHNTIGQDLVAMCANDILVQGAESLFFLDYYATAKLDVDVASRVVKGIAAACAKIGCALIGGETAEMPGLYHDGDYDLAGFVVGAVERDQLVTGENVSEGDVIYALPSSGLHSNGFSLVRKIIADAGLNYSDACPWDKSLTLGEALIVPTELYGATIKQKLGQHGKDIKAMAHITGGGLLENIPRVVPTGLKMELNESAWDIPPVFQWLRDKGQIDQRSLLRTFNCGVGFVMIGSENAKLSDLVIGKITKA